jgi:hypothetical protein
MSQTPFQLPDLASLSAMALMCRLEMTQSKVNQFIGILRSTGCWQSQVFALTRAAAALIRSNGEFVVVGFCLMEATRKIRLTGAIKE